MTSRLSRSLALLFATCLLSCGYTLLDPSVTAGRTLSIPVTVNNTRWHGIENSLTQHLRNESNRQLDVHLGSQSPDYELRTRIGNVSRQHRIGTAIGLARLQIHWSLVDSLGKTLTEGQVSRNLEFLPNENEDPYTVFNEISADAAEEIMMQILAHLSSDPS